MDNGKHSPARMAEMARAIDDALADPQPPDAPASGAPRPVAPHRCSRCSYGHYGNAKLFYCARIRNFVVRDDSRECPLFAELDIRDPAMDRLLVKSARKRIEIACSSCDGNGDADTCARCGMASVKKLIDNLSFC